MSSMLRPKVSVCYPAARHHKWKVLAKNKHGEVRKIQCVHCGQIASGIRVCEYFKWKDDFKEDNASNDASAN